MTNKTTCTQCGKPLGEYSVIMPTTDPALRERCVECASGDKTTMERYNDLFEKCIGFYEVAIPREVLDFIRSEISQAIKERDQQWIEAVGEDEKVPHNESWDKVSLINASEETGKAEGRNQLRHQIKDKMGLGEEVDLISPLVVE